MKAWQRLSRVYAVVQDQSLARQQEWKPTINKKKKAEETIKKQTFVGVSINILIDPGRPHKFTATKVVSVRNIVR